MYKTKQTNEMKLLKHGPWTENENAKIKSQQLGQKRDNNIIYIRLFLTYSTAITFLMYDIWDSA